MATKHFNLPIMATGAVDWVALFNDAMNKIEAGRTLKHTAGENLVKGRGYKVKPADSKAYLADNVDNIIGLWQSSSTPLDTEGFGQYDGTMTDSGWSWTVGVFLYSDSGVLTETQIGLRAVAYAISASGIVIIPPHD